MFRMVLFVFIFVFLFIYITLLNPQPVQIKLYKTISYTMPLSALIIAALTIGFILSYLFNVIKDVYQGATLSSLKRKLFKQDDIKNKMAEAFIISDIFSVKASQNYLKEKRLDKDPFLTAVYARFLRQMGEQETAKELHAMSKKEAENFSYPLYEFLSDIYEDGRYTELVSLVKELDKKLLSPPILWIASNAAKEIGDYEMALVWGEKLVKDLRDDVAVDYLLGVKTEYYREKGNVSGIKRILKKHPDFVPAVLAVVEQGDINFVMKVVKEAYKKTKDATYLVLLVDLMVKKEEVNPSKIIDFVKNISSSAEKDERVLMVLAYLYAQVGMYDEAVKALSEISELENVGFVNFVKAKVAKGLKKYEDCCKELEGALEKSGLLYRCEECGSIYSELKAFCEKCRRYNTVKVEMN